MAKSNLWHKYIMQNYHNFLWSKIPQKDKPLTIFSNIYGQTITYLDNIYKIDNINIIRDMCYYVNNNQDMIYLAKSVLYSLGYPSKTVDFIYNNETSQSFFIDEGTVKTIKFKLVNNRKREFTDEDSK